MSLHSLLVGTQAFSFSFLFLDLIPAFFLCVCVGGGGGGGAETPFFILSAVVYIVMLSLFTCHSTSLHISSETLLKLMAALPHLAGTSFFFFFLYSMKLPFHMVLIYPPPPQTVRGYTEITVHLSMCLGFVQKIPSGSLYLL